MKWMKKCPKYPLVWLGGILGLTLMCGCMGLKMHRLYQVLVPGQREAGEAVVVAIDRSVETEQQKAWNMEGLRVVVERLFLHTSPVNNPVGKVQKRSTHALPELQEWNEENTNRIGGSQASIDRMEAILGRKQGAGSYKAQLRALSLLQENTRFDVCGAGKTGLFVESKEISGSHGAKARASLGLCQVYLMEETWEESLPIEVTVVNRGEGFALERLDGDGVIPRTEKEGYHFAGWWKDGKELSASFVEADATFVARYVDDIAPEVSVTTEITSSGKVMVTLQAEDLGDGVAGAYIGTMNPETEAVIFLGTDGNSYVGVDALLQENAPSSSKVQYFTMQQELETKGDYFLAAVDVNGNLVTQEFHVYEVAVELDEQTSGLDHFLAADLEENEAPAPSKNGYGFEGWKELGTTGENSGDTFTSLQPDHDMVLTPVFSAKPYTIYLDATPGNCNPGSVEVFFDAAIGELPVPERTGYVFGGWFTAADGSGTLYTAETVMTSSKDITLYAKWSPIHYTIRFAENGGTSGQMASMEAIYDETYQLPRNAFARPGYSFQGWSTDAGAVSVQNSLNARDRSYNGSQWLNEESVMNLATEDGDEVVLYAVWQAIVPGTMEYRYCLGAYQYFACVTTSYATDNNSNEGALFVAMTPSGNGGMRFGDTANWSTSHVRANLNDANQVDLTGLKTTNTTVNYTYSGVYYNYSPNEQCPCFRDDMGYGGRLTAATIGAPNYTEDYMFVPDVRDFYRYYAGNSWNWFWDMNLDGYAETVPISGMTANGPTDEYYACVNRANALWIGMGWDGRCWFRNSYTGYGNYPLYISSYGVGVCNPSNGAFAGYRNYCTSPLLIRAMYTMPM